MLTNKYYNNTIHPWTFINSIDHKCQSTINKVEEI